MAEQQSKPVRFISKLVQLTQERKIEWEVAGTQGSGPSFVATVEGRRLKIFKYSEKQPNPDYARLFNNSGAFTLSTLTISGRPNPPETIIVQGIVLEIADDAGRPAYKFDNRAGLADLYESASFSASKVDELMDTVLAKK